MESSSLSRGKLALVSIVVASALASYLVYHFLLVNQLPFRSDEAQRSLSSLFLTRFLRSGHWFSFFSLSYSLSYYPFVFYWLTSASFLLIGESFEAARLVSLLFFFLAPIVMYFIAKELSKTKGNFIGLTAAFLWLTSPAVLVVSSTANMEISGVFFSLAVVLSFLWALRREQLRFYLLTCFLMIVLLLFKYNFAAFTILSVLIVYLGKIGYSPKKLVARESLLLFGPLVLVALVWFFPVSRDLQVHLVNPRSSAIIAMVPFLTDMFGFASFYSTKAFTPMDQLLYYPSRFPGTYTFSWLTAALMGAAAIYCLRYWKDLRVRLLLVFFWLYFIAGEYMMVKSERHLVLALPALFMLTGLFLSRAWDWFRRLNLSSAWKTAVPFACLFVLVLPAVSVPRQAKAYQDGWNNGITDSAPVNDALAFMAGKVDLNKKGWLIGSFDELPAALTFWNFLVSDKQRLGLDIYFPPPVGQPYFQKEFEPGLQGAYKDEMAKLDRDKIDFVIAVYPEKGSLYHQFDYDFANAWQMNYIYLMPEQQNYYLPDGNVFTEGGIVVKIYLRKQTR